MHERTAQALGAEDLNGDWYRGRVGWVVRVARTRYWGGVQVCVLHGWWLDPSRWCYWGERVTSAACCFDGVREARSATICVGYLGGDLYLDEVTRHCGLGNEFLGWLGMCLQRWLDLGRLLLVWARGCLLGTPARNVHLPAAQLGVDHALGLCKHHRALAALRQSVEHVDAVLDECGQLI